MRQAKGIEYFAVLTPHMDERAIDEIFEKLAGIEGLQGTRQTDLTLALFKADDDDDARELATICLGPNELISSFTRR